jgi:hypothetical protein
MAVPFFAALCPTLRVAGRAEPADHHASDDPGEYAQCLLVFGSQPGPSPQNQKRGERMSKTRVAVIFISTITMAVTIYTGLVLATPSTGSSTLIGRGTYDEFKIKREMPGLELDLKSRTDVDIATQIITFKSGTDSGWHKHPGPVFISVVSGTMTFYDSDDPDCSPVVRTAGQGFVDLGLHAHIARNESGLPATNVVTYFAPVGAPLRIDEPRPGNCPVF